MTVAAEASITATLNPVTFGKRIGDLAYRHPHRPAVIEVRADDSRRTYTWSELDSLSNRLARRLIAEGVEPGKMVAISIPNRFEHIAALVGVWKAGGCALSINPRSPGPERHRLLSLGQPVVVLEGSDLAVDEFDPSPLPDRVPSPGRAVGSGGSTGDPKLIVRKGPWTKIPGRPHEHDVGLSAGQRQLVVGPLYHNGPSGWCMTGLFEDHTIVLLEKFDPVQVLRLIPEFRIQFLFMVPAMMVRLLDRLSTAPADLSSIESLVHAGAGCPVWLKRAFIEVLGPDHVFEGFGSTEIGSVVIRGDEWLAHPGSVGKAHDDRLRILREDGSRCDPDEVGEIFFRAPDGDLPFYYLGPYTPKVIDHEWVGVGDLGAIDQFGYLRIADRKVDMIISGGANVYPAEVEAVLMEHPDVNDVAVVGLADRAWGHRVHAVVASRAGAHPSAKVLEAHCRQRLSHFKVPKSYDFVSSLPRDEMGKIRRSALAEVVPDKAKREQGGEPQTPRGPFNQDILDGLRFVKGADLSPDGRHVVYVLFTTDPKLEKDFEALWLIDVHTGSTRQLTAGLGKDWAPTFSPDGKEVAFVSDRSGKAQIHVIPLDGGEARQVTTLAMGVGGAAVWSPDRKFLAFSAPRQEEPRDPSKAYRVTRAIYRFDATGYIDDVKQDIYVVSVGGGQARRLTDDDTMNVNPLWTPDGGGVVYFASLQPESTVPWSCLRHVDLEGRVTEIPQPDGSAAAVGFTPNGKLVFQIITHSDRPIGSKSELYVTDIATGAYERRTRTLNGQVGGGLLIDLPASRQLSRVQVTDDGKAAIQVQARGTVPVYKIALEGEESFEQVVKGRRFCLPLASVGNKILFTASDFNDPGDLYLLEGEREQRLTTINEHIMASVDLPDVEKVIARGADGERVEGWFLKPPRGKSPYPTILYIHGGPHAAFGHTFHADMQLLAGAGYGVLLVNQRGSTGYGDAFATKIIGDWGNHDYLDLMACVDRAIELGLADADRLGVTGLSGGGYLTCWIVSHTNRFKAAVPQNPITDFISMFGVTDGGIWFAQAEAGGLPHEVLETYLRMSPIIHAHRCTTPTLLIHAEMDMRCPPEQSEQFYAALKAAGCPVEMLRLPHMSHVGGVVGPLPIRRAQNEALIEWFDRWILDKSASREAKLVPEKGSAAK